MKATIKRRQAVITVTVFAMAVAGAAYAFAKLLPPLLSDWRSKLAFILLLAILLAALGVALGSRKR